MRLVATTNPNMEKENKDKKVKYLEYPGSPFMYPVLYICTINDTVVITTSIITEIGSSRIPKSTSILLNRIHVVLIASTATKGTDLLTIKYLYAVT